MMITGHQLYGMHKLIKQKASRARLVAKAKPAPAVHKPTFKVTASPPSRAYSLAGLRPRKRRASASPAIPPRSMADVMAALLLERGLVATPTTAATAVNSDPIGASLPPSPRSLSAVMRDQLQARGLAPREEATLIEAPGVLLSSQPRR